MTYEIYRYIFMGGAILSILMLSISVILFITLHIPNIIGDLTGKNARREIENIRNRNINSGVKTYKSSLVNRERGKITEKISQSGKIKSSVVNMDTGAMATERLPQEIDQQTDLLDAQNMTSDIYETSILHMSEIGTETSVLEQITPEHVFEIEYEITFTHSDKIII